MRPAMMLLLRALVILGAALAVLSCGFAVPLGPPDSESTAGGSHSERCTRVPFSKPLASVPAAGGTGASFGAGLCP